MARRNRGGQYSLTASAVSVTAALSLTGNDHFAKITIKNANGAANPVFFGGSDVTNVPANAHGELIANQSYTFGGDGRGFYKADEVFVVGTVNAANIVFIQLEE